MNRLWIALAVLALLLALCFAGTFAVQNRVDSVLGLLTAARDAAVRGDYPTAEKRASEADAYWTENAVLLGSLLRHDEADGVTEQLAEIRSYAAARDGDELLALCAAAMRRLMHIREMELPLVQNVL